MATQGCRCPTVANDVGSQFSREMQTHAEVFQVAIEDRQTVFVLRMGRRAGGEYREKVGARGCRRGIFADDLPHPGGDFHADLDSGLATVIDQLFAPDIVARQIRHIDKGHAACQETEDEHIAHQTERRTREGERLKPLDDVLTYPALDGALYSGIDLAEGMGLLGQALRHAAIVYGTEGTQVTGDGIEAYAAALEPVFIIGQQGGGDGTEGKVAHGTEGAKGTKGGGIIARGAVTAGGCHAADFGRHVMEKGGAALTHGTGRGGGLTG